MQRYRERERRELVARWYRFHADMSELHARLSQEHQRKAERLCQEEPPAQVYARRDGSGPYPESGEKGREQAVASRNGRTSAEGPEEAL